FASARARRRTRASWCNQAVRQSIASTWHDSFSRFRQRLERGADTFGYRNARRKAFDGRVRFLLAVAERKQRIHHVARPLLRRRGDLGELAPQLEEQPLRGFLADAR